MAGILVLLLIIGSFLWLLWYLFFRSLLWVAEPLIEYFEGREAERFSIEGFDKDEFNDSDLEEIPKSKIKVTIKDFDKPIHFSKTFLDHIFPTKPTEEKIKEIFKN